MWQTMKGVHSFPTLLIAYCYNPYSTLTQPRFESYPTCFYFRLISFIIIFLYFLFFYLLKFLLLSTSYFTHLNSAILCPSISTSQQHKKQSAHLYCTSLFERLGGGFLLTTIPPYSSALICSMHTTMVLYSSSTNFPLLLSFFSTSLHSSTS